MKHSILIAIVTLILIVGQISADTHYVSKAGSNTYPYQRWETAADSISKAIDAAESGDTVRVGVGTYYEHVIMKAGIALIGAGRDSCTIDIHQSPEGDVVIAADSILIEGFNIIGKSNEVGIIDNRLKVKHEIIRANYICNCRDGIFSANWHDTNVVHEITDNVFSNNEIGIWFDNVGAAVIANNQFIDNRRAIYGQWGKPFILNNEIRNTESQAIEWLDLGEGVIKNNLISGVKKNGGLGVGGDKLNLLIENNTVNDGGGEGVWIGGKNIIVRNNIITNNDSEGVRGTTDPIYVFNNVWANGGNDIRADSIEGNISVDPMFVGNGDYSLQYASPCIDVGDPSIHDVDGSRSDMGAYGGLGGESYQYLDLPPLPPKNLFVIFPGDKVILAWGVNTESDISHYDIYRDTVSGFIPGDENRISSSISPIYYDLDIQIGPLYFYQVTAWDRTGHQSEPSKEIMVATTDVEDIAYDDETEPASFRLFQNYPNPFNATTDIRYEIPDGGSLSQTTLAIFDVLGREVRVLVSEEQEAGNYCVEWDGRDSFGREVSSGMYFSRLSWGEQRQTRRMLFVK